MGILPQATASLVLKEWLTLFRDTRRLSGVVWPLGVVLVYAVASGRRQASVGGSEAYRFWLSNAWLALVPWGVSLGLSLYAVGTERRNIDLLRLLPLSPRQIVLGKVVASFVPIVLFSAAIAVIVSVVGGASPSQIAGMLALVAWTSVGFVVADTAAAAIAPNFEADHVQRTTDLVGRAFGLAAGSAFGLLTSVAATRLVLFAVGTPEPLEPVLNWQLLGIAPLGWPLVVAALSGAALLLVAVVRIAEDSFAQLIRNGP
jgi:ABC-type transport system involved in multi-copper enzyme maturation permease subunit